MKKILLTVLLLLTFLVSQGVVLGAEEVRSYSLTDEQFNFGRMLHDEFLSTYPANELSSHFPDFIAKLDSYGAGVPALSPSDRTFVRYPSLIATFGLTPTQTTSSFVYCVYDKTEDPEQQNPHIYSCSYPPLYRSTTKYYDFFYEPVSEEGFTFTSGDSDKYHEQILFYLVVNEETPFSLRWKHNDRGSYVVQEVPLNQILSFFETQPLDECCGIRAQLYDLLSESNYRSGVRDLDYGQNANGDWWGEAETKIDATLRPGNVYLFSFLTGDDRARGSRKNIFSYTLSNSSTATFKSLANLPSESDVLFLNFVNLYDYLYAIKEGTISESFYDGHTYEAVCVGMGGDFDADAEKSCCGMPDTVDSYVDSSSGMYCEAQNDGTYRWIPFLDNYNADFPKGYCSKDGVADALNYDDVSGDFSAYDFSANNGSDGCCGDDAPCLPKDCSCMSVTVAKDVAGCRDEGDAEYVGTPLPEVATSCAMLSRDECVASEICYFDETSSDNGYTSFDGQFLCGKDYDKNDDGITIGDSASWKWWDAGASGVPFKIHSLNGVDYISNGLEWFYCDASGDVPVQGGAQPIADTGSFSSASPSGEISCVEALNVVQEELDIGNHAFTRCDEGETEYCCNVIDGNIASYNPANGFLDSSLCKENCYLADGQFFGDYLIQDSDVEASILNTYCSAYSVDATCPDSNPSFSLNTGSTGFVEQDVCGVSLENCLQETAAFDQPCENIAFSLDVNNDGEPEDYEGVLCGTSEPEYCITQEYLLSSDTGSAENNNVCCMAPTTMPNYDVCEPIQSDVTEQDCQAVGNDYMPVEQTPQYICSPTNSAVGGCCIGGTWRKTFSSLLSEASFVQNNSFFCYEQSGNNYISECCNDYSICHNAQTGSFSKSPTMSKYLHAYYGKGGVLHTVMNFDELRDGKVVDYVYVDRSFTDALTIYVHRSEKDLDFRRLANWTSFDYLEFDVAFNLNKIDTIKLYDTSSPAHVCTSEHSLSRYLVNGQAPMRWHHVVIPLTDFKGENCSTVLEDVGKIELTTTYTGGNLQTAVDDFFLSENDTGEKNNTDNYYCAGDFGQWVNNLDGPTDEGITCEEGDDCFLAKGPYWYACESQASFDWTGVRCCGDDTRKQNGAGEYYIDTEAACFSGTTIYSDMSVGEALNNASYNDLLFYVDSQGTPAYYLCNWDENDDVNNYASQNISYNDTSDTKEPLMDTSTDFLKQDFDVLGSHICMPSGEWVTADSISKARLIAAQLYNVAGEEVNKNDPSFALYCDDVQAISPLLFSDEDGSTIDDLTPYIKDFCVLSYADASDEEPDSILIGLSLQDTTIEPFLSELFSHIQLFDKTILPEETSSEILDEEKKDFAKACSTIIPGDERDDFFAPCDYNGFYDDIKLAYSPEFKTLFIAQSNGKSDFNNLFATKGKIATFTQNILDAFIGFFSSWFTNEEEGFSSDALLPLFSNETINFNHFYLTQQGEKQITGFALETKYRNDDMYTITYQNIHSSVERLASQYYFSNPLSFNYLAGNVSGTEKQVISLLNPNNPELRLDYEPDFDWRRLTTGLTLDSSVSYEEGTYASRPNNNELELGEICDTDVFRGDNNSCEFWNMSYTNEKNVTCTKDGEINFSVCEEKTCTELGLVKTFYEYYSFKIDESNSYNPKQAIDPVKAEGVCCSSSSCSYQNNCFTSGFELTLNDFKREFFCDKGVWRIADADESGCDSSKEHTYCQSTGRCVADQDDCPCDLSCQTRTADGSCVSDCTSGKTCSPSKNEASGSCCDTFCLEDDASDKQKCEDGCNDDLLLYCWNDCELYVYEQELQTSRDPQSVEDVEINYLRLDDVTAEQCAELHPNLLSCTEEQCDTRQNNCAWHEQTKEELLTSADSSTQQTTTTDYSDISSEESFT